ncbi:MAG: class I SAM-dependent methyltransferase, partial [Nitrospirota bacterium]
MGNVRAKLREKIIGKRTSGLLVPIYEKAARMVIDSYYVPIAEEIVAELSQITTPGPETGRRMLDLGTGPGYLPIEIVKRVPNLRVDGIDPLLKSIKIARKNAARAEVGERVHFEVGDAAKLRFRDNSYDMIISTGMLHELEDPVKVLNECYRVLKPGGKVFIHDPARVSVGIDKEKWRASFNLREKIIYRLYTLFSKIDAPDTYSQKEAEEIIAATHFKHYQIEEYWIKG